jgi:hypothetical protein
MFNKVNKDTISALPVLLLFYPTLPVLVSDLVDASPVGVGAVL